MSDHGATSHHLDAGERWLYAGAMAALVAGAWMALGLVSASAYAPYLSHDLPDDAAPWPLWGRAGVFVGGWTLMCVAMMLPSSLPLVTVFRTVTRRAPALVVLLVAGYLAIWAAFGLAGLGADGLVHAFVARSGWSDGPRVIPAALLLTAGLFQFSSLKHSCLEQCRSPLGFVVSHWRGGSRAWRAFALGVRHGVFCVGCCWAMMLLMLGAGGVSVAWMLALGAVMFIEKVVAGGRWITVPVGTLLSVWGLGLLARVPGVPAPF
jgi:predicted metal-binding membrane protein